MLDMQQLTFHANSGNLNLDIVTFMLLDGGRLHLKMWHKQWTFDPVSTQLKGCMVIP